MFFKRIFTESIAHFSYMIGNENQIIVIDPQADIKKYLDISKEEGLKITKIFETHRNEDFAVGSNALSKETGADVYISEHDDLEYEYGEKIKDGFEYEFGNLKLQAIHTPGHTNGHMSYLLYEEDSPYILFSGDSLFYGDIGRLDLYGEDELNRTASNMYDSLFNKILPIGDEVILAPAHGPGSACGGNIDERPVSSIGYEKKNNTKLQYDSKEDFIKNVANMMHKPLYFDTVEKLNLKGIDRIDDKIEMNIIKVDELNHYKIVDIRNKDAFSNSHIPNSLFISAEGLGSFLGLFVKTDTDICFITDNMKSSYLDKLYLDMRRLGYMHKLGFLAGGIDTYYEAGKKIEKLGMIYAGDLRDKKDDDNYLIIDVRKEDEVKKDSGIDGSKNIPLQEFESRMNEIPKDKNLIFVCPSSMRSTIAASLIKKEINNASVLVGGLLAWEKLD